MCGEESWGHASVPGCMRTVWDYVVQYKGSASSVSDMSTKETPHLARGLFGLYWNT